MTYSEKLKDPRWQKKRLEILSRDEFTCQLCNSTDLELHVHHGYYERGKDVWDYPKESFNTYCKYCHFIIEFFRKQPDKFEVLESNKHISPAGNDYYVCLVKDGLKDKRYIAIFLNKSGCMELEYIFKEYLVYEFLKVINDNKERK